MGDIRLPISNRLKIPTAIVCLIASHSFVLAQTTQEQLINLLLTGDTSKFSAPVTILNDHPQCNGPGMVAFSVLLEANDVDFDVSGDQWDGTVQQFSRYDALTETNTCIMGQQLHGRITGRPEDRCNVSESRRQVFREDIGPTLCYRTERRGTEKASVEVACPTDVNSDQPESLNALVRAADIEIDMSASADVCKSLSGVGLLNSEWSIAVTTGDETETFTGRFGPNRWFDPREETPINVRLGLSQGGLFLMEVSDEIRNGPFQLDPIRSGSFRMSFEIEPFVLANAPLSPLRIEAGRSFRLDIQ